MRVQKLFLTLVCGVFVYSALPARAESPARRPLVVAAIAVRSEIRQTDANLDQIERWARRAAKAGADLVLFPECGIHCWWQNLENRKYAEPIDGPSIRRLIRLAKELKVILAVGMTELDGDKAYITHVLLDGNGVIGKHRKSSLAGGPNGEGRIWNQGNDANVFDVLGHKIGIAICYESVHPETCAKLRANGAEIILAPYANGTRPSEISDPEPKQRKWVWKRPVENHVWYVACDSTAAFIINPEGKLVALDPKDEPGNGMVIYTIPPARRPTTRPAEAASTQPAGS